MVLIVGTHGARHLSCLGSLSSSICLGGPVTKSHLLRWNSLAWHWGEERDPERCCVQFPSGQGLLLKQLLYMSPLAKLCDALPVAVPP